MATGERPLGRGTSALHTMLSFEPFTLKDIGSPQVFQTGETFNGEPLIDYQHPHDLFLTLNVAYARPFGSWTLTTTAAAVGAPALGPPPFMHRPSAAENPQSPLGHHHLDSVHITPGVLMVGIARGGYRRSKRRGSMDASRTRIAPTSTSGRWIPGRCADRGRRDHGARNCPART